MKKVSLILSAVVLTSMMLSACGDGASVTIGKQVWMTKNLNVDKFRNGDPIPEAKTNEEWLKAGENKQPAWCYYNNDPTNGVEYGKIYNWYAVNDSRGLAPEGWKIPSNEDLFRLTDFLGGERLAGKKMKSTAFWPDYRGESGNGTNESKFSGLPGGGRNDEGRFDNFAYYGNWWCSTEEYTYASWHYHLTYRSGEAAVFTVLKEMGSSVRCIKD